MPQPVEHPLRTKKPLKFRELDRSPRTAQRSDDAMRAQFGLALSLDAFAVVREVGQLAQPKYASAA
jgi:hypothetical protein